MDLKEFRRAVIPADNLKVADMEQKVERSVSKAKTPGQIGILRDIQCLIERIKGDDRKLRELQKGK